MAIPVSSRSLFERFTLQFRMLGVISVLLFIMLLILGLKLVNDFNRQIDLTQQNIKLSVRPVTQLQRQVFLLWLLVKNDPAEYDHDAVELQKELIQAQFGYVYDIAFDVILTADIEKNFSQVDFLWQNMQPELLKWQANPHDEVATTQLLTKIKSLEIGINNIITDYVNQRRLQNIDYIDNTLTIFQLLQFVLFGILALASIVAIATYYFIRERQYTLQYLQRTNDDLELRVVQRTQDLQATNGLLQQEINERELAQIKLNAANEQLQADLQTARQIQQGLLPAIRPPWKRLDVICYNMPATEVGGDFYAYHRFDSNNFALTIGDVSGKGMPAALLMAASLAHFDSALAYKLPPAHLLNHLDRALLRYTQPTRQNCALCYVELSKELSTNQGLMKVNDHPWKLISVNAGGIPPFIKRQNGSVEWPEIGGFALGQGLGSEIGYKQLETLLNPGDMVILTSDGVAEATNQHNEFLGFERLEALILQGPLTSAQAMLNHMLLHINQFVGLAAPHDDLTIVVIQV